MTGNQRVGAAFIAVDYRGGAHEDLKRLRDGVATLTGLWTNDAGVEHGLCDLDPSGHPQSLLRAVRDWCQGFQEDDILVLYWGGHGVVEAGKLWLLTRDSPMTRLDHHLAVGPDDLVRAVGHLVAKAALVIIDACYSGGALRDVTDFVLSIGDERYAVPRLGVLASCRPFETAMDGALVERFIDVLTEGPTNDVHRWTDNDRWVRTGAFVDEVRGQLPRWIDHEGISELTLIPNPQWNPAFDEAAVTTTRPRALWSSSAMPHFLHASEHSSAAAFSSPTSSAGWPGAEPVKLEETYLRGIY